MISEWRKRISEQGKDDIGMVKKDIEAGERKEDMIRTVRKEVRQCGLEWDMMCTNWQRGGI